MLGAISCLLLEIIPPSRSNKQLSLKSISNHIAALLLVSPWAAPPAAPAATGAASAGASRTPHSGKGCRRAAPPAPPCSPHLRGKAERGKGRRYCQVRGRRRRRLARERRLMHVAASSACVSRLRSSTTASRYKCSQPEKQRSTASTSSGQPLASLGPPTCGEH